MYYFNLVSICMSIISFSLFEGSYDCSKALLYYKMLTITFKVYFLLMFFISSLHVTNLKLVFSFWNNAKSLFYAKKKSNLCRRTPFIQTFIDLGFCSSFNSNQVIFYYSLRKDVKLFQLRH